MNKNNKKKNIWNKINKYKDFSFLYKVIWLNFYKSM